MKKYIVISLHLGGRGNKIFKSKDIVNETDFNPGAAEKLVAEGHLKPYTQEAIETAPSGKPTAQENKPAPPKKISFVEEAKADPEKLKKILDALSKMDGEVPREIERLLTSEDNDEFISGIEWLKSLDEEEIALLNPEAQELISALEAHQTAGPDNELAIDDFSKTEIKKKLIELNIPFTDRDSKKDLFDLLVNAK